MTFDELHRRYRFYEALALYDAYYERAADLNDDYKTLGDALDIAWVPLVFHCTYFDKLAGIMNDGLIRPGKRRNSNEMMECVCLTELTIIELTRFRALRTKVPFEIAIGFPRIILEKRGLFQPAYLKHAQKVVKDKFKGLSPDYVELDSDLGALHEVRVPGSLPINDAVWVLSSKRNEMSGGFDIPELMPLKARGIAISFWTPDHQKEMIREPVFRKVKRDADNNLESLDCCGKHYLPDIENTVEKTIAPPHANKFTLRFPKEIRSETLKDGWEGPFSKFEMATFCFEELKRSYSSKISEVQPRIEM